MSKTKVFIGSSKESLNVARELQGELQRRNSNLAVIVWDQNIVVPSQYTLPELIDEIRGSRYAIFVFHSDDTAFIRGEKYSIARDNVTFECGLACGLLGKDNVFIYKEKECKLPSDFSGLQYTDYVAKDFEQFSQSYIGPAISSIEKAIKNNDLNIVSWETYTKDIEVLGQKLKKSSRQGGFHYSCILGISRGGLIVADMINRYLNCPGPLFSVNQSFHATNANANFNVSSNQYLFDMLGQKEYEDILIIDDISRTGTTVVTFTQMIRDLFPQKTVKSAVLYIPKEYAEKVDYCGSYIDKDAKEQMPYSILDK